jgi:hypothetical protein
MDKLKLQKPVLPVLDTMPDTFTLNTVALYLKRKLRSKHIRAAKLLYFVPLD